MHCQVHSDPVDPEVKRPKRKYDKDKAKEWRETHKAKHPSYFRDYYRKRNGSVIVTNCTVCDADISKTTATKYCKSCAVKANKDRQKVERRATRFCVDCKTSLGKALATLKLCEVCRTVRTKATRSAWNQRNGRLPGSSTCTTCSGRCSRGRTECCACQIKREIKCRSEALLSRVCGQCAIGIGHRDRAAKFCEPCAEQRGKKARKEGFKRWTIENPDRNKERSQAVQRNRRAQAYKTGNKITMQQWRDILAKYENKCAYCAEPATTMDHIIPLSAGGLHNADNVVPACSPCNCSKGVKSVEDWKPGFTFTR